MNADEARKLAQTNAHSVEQARAAKVSTLHAQEVELLHNHFREKIAEAASQGKLSTEAAGIKLEFPQDRFGDEVVSEAVNLLRVDKYAVEKHAHNAFKTVRFNISWV